MSQISPPIRILLVCAVAFMAAWMLFLRPSSDAGTPAVAEPVPTAATPPVAAGGETASSGAGKAVEAANNATAQQDARAEQLAGGAPESAPAPAAAATSAEPAPVVTSTGAPTAAAMPSREVLQRVPAGVREAIVKRQIVVLGVTARRGVDERLVRESLGKVDKLHGRVYVQTVPVKRISRYRTIVGGADLTQTPSVIVVDFGLKATTLAGWVDTPTVNQAVVDAIRNSGRLYPDEYLRAIAQECNKTFPDMRVLGEAESGAQYSHGIGRFGVLTGRLKTNIAGLETPGKWRPFSRALVADLGTLATIAANWRAALGPNPTFPQAVAAYKRYRPGATRAADRINKRFDHHDVLACGSKSG